MLSRSKFEVNLNRKYFNGFCKDKKEREHTQINNQDFVKSINKCKQLNN